MNDISNIQADFETHRIEGMAVHGNTLFSCPIVTHVEGNLWQGGTIGGVELPVDFKHVISLYPWEQYKVSEGTKVTEFKMYDSGNIPDTDDLHTAVRLVENALALNDGLVLVKCQAGLNRSGLVTALVLIRAGRTEREAVEHMRAVRSPAVLCNPYFYDWLTNGAAALTLHRWAKMEEAGDL